MDKVRYLYQTHHIGLLRSIIDLLSIVKIAIVIFTMDRHFMKTIKTKLFAKWAIKNDVSDQSLLNAA